ncbi:hypothetical protein B0I35DRAFT_425550 [Stachybotrys elegans]|uniref:Uncharacterized protein n=1 Tax=Stachybotrys elegans TaxID=80388 RepID=A0A8K0SYD6_9HYPO|nr:hypothetical protein B0I35DRAFT_425550 [Stachybotrys elegans]
MAPAKRSVRFKPKEKSKRDGPPPPFKQPPEVLEPFINQLDEKHVYVTHIDGHPASFKWRIFLVPVAMNVGVAALFVWRMYAIIPWYWELVKPFLGLPSAITFAAEQSTWPELIWEISKRTAVFLVDFLLFVFVWPWPVEFTMGRRHGNPTRWRWNVGFQDKEIYVRRSRDWDTVIGDYLEDGDGHKILTTYIKTATAPLLQEQKTGYLLMNGQWDLDWAAMVLAHRLVDKKEVALEAFKNAVLMYHEDHGWLCYDLGISASVEEDTKRRQVFAFRDALTALGKEDLFYRWVEIVQFESTQPGGFGPEKQEAAAQKIRDLFEAGGVNFDELWKESNSN